MAMQENIPVISITQSTWGDDKLEAARESTTEQSVDGQGEDVGIRHTGTLCT